MGAVPHNKFSLKSRNAYFSRFESFNLQHNLLNRMAHDALLLLPYLGIGEGDLISLLI